MNFPYGISPESLARWYDFERLCWIQARRGPQVGGSVMCRIVDAELEAIERATAEEERRESRPPTRRSGLGAAQLPP